MKGTSVDNWIIFAKVHCNRYSEPNHLKRAKKHLLISHGGDTSEFSKVNTFLYSIFCSMVLYKKKVNIMLNFISKGKKRKSPIERFEAYQKNYTEKELKKLLGKG